MKQIENEFNKRFKDKKLSNDGFDSAGLWDAIATDLEEKSPVPPSSNGKRKWLLGMLAAMLFLGVGYLLFQKNTARQDTAFNVKNTEVAKGGSSNSNPITEQKNSINEAKSLSTEVEKNKAAKVDEIGNTKQIPLEMASKVAENAPIVSEKNGLRTISTTPIKPRFTQDTTKQKTNLATLDNTMLVNVPQNNKGTQSLTTTLDEIGQKGALASLQSNLIPLPSKAIVPIPFTAPYVYEKNKKGNTTTQWQFGLEGGINTLSFNYKSAQQADAAGLKNKAEKTLPGSNFGFTAGLLLKNRWMVQTGLEYQQSWSKLDIELEKNTTVVKAGQLVKIWVEAGTQDTLKKEYADITVDALQTRHVVHYNQYKQFRIPLLFGVQEQHKSLLYGLSLGPVLHFTTAQEGKSIDNSSEIIDFNHKSSTSTLSSSGVGFRISPLLGVQLGTQWSVYLRPAWSWQGNTGLFDSDMKVGVHQVHLNVGVLYAL